MQHRKRKRINSAERPSFFKIIASSRSNERLRVPPHFKKYVSMELFDKVILRSPSGTHCQITLQKGLEGIYLTDGWPQFMIDHMLGDYEFLLFTHVEDTLFDVEIFEKSGCERINASCNGNPFCKREMKRRDEAQLQPVLGTGEISDLKKPEKENPLQVMTEMVEVDFKIGALDIQSKKIERKTINQQAKDGTNQPAETMEALKMAEAFDSRHPFFWVWMTRRSAGKCPCLHLPASFSRAHLPRAKVVLTLQNLEGKTWNLTTRYYKRFHSFSAGWPALAKSNMIKPGDICLFELVDKNLLQFHIFESGVRSQHIRVEEDEMR